MAWDLDRQQHDVGNNSRSDPQSGSAASRLARSCSTPSYRNAGQSAVRATESMTRLRSLSFQ